MDGGIDFRLAIRRHDTSPVLAYQLFRFVPHEAVGAGVGEGDVSLLIQHDDPFAHVLDHTLVELHEALEGLFRPLALGDVYVGDEDTG